MSCVVRQRAKCAAVPRVRGARARRCRVSCARRFGRRVIRGDAASLAIFVCLRCIPKNMNGNRNHIIVGHCI
jgi:hypothetical protein